MKFQAFLVADGLPLVCSLSWCKIRVPYHYCLSDLFFVTTFLSCFIFILSCRDDILSPEILTRDGRYFVWMLKANFISRWQPLIRLVFLFSRHLRKSGIKR